MDDDTGPGPPAAAHTPGGLRLHPTLTVPRAGLTGRARCLIADCGYVGSEEYRWDAEARAAWHVYEAHPDVWAATAGLGPTPRAARPEGTVR